MWEGCGSRLTSVLDFTWSPVEKHGRADRRTAARTERAGPGHCKHLGLGQWSRGGVVAGWAEGDSSGVTSHSEDAARKTSSDGVGYDSCPL